VIGHHDRAWRESNATATGTSTSTSTSTSTTATHGRAVRQSLGKLDFAWTSLQIRITPIKVSAVKIT
jgi:hypothetical protein